MSVFPRRAVQKFNDLFLAAASTIWTRLGAFRTIRGTSRGTGLCTYKWLVESQPRAAGCARSFPN